MYVKLLTSLVGKGFSLSPGQIIDRPEAEAQRLIDAGYAVPATDEDFGLSFATSPDAEPAETRQASTGKHRKRRGNS